MRFFNITGSCDPARHYMLPAERRLLGCEALIAKGAYFVVHAPRQTGKTTAMKALARRLTAEGGYAALRFSCQNAQVFSVDIGAAEKTVWAEVEASARNALPEDLRPPARVDVDPGSFLRAQLARWSEVCPRPLVLIFDEIDAIGGPERFGTSSPFNIKEKSLRIVNFTEAEMRELYAQHTAETGQAFTERALERAWALTHAVQAALAKPATVLGRERGGGRGQGRLPSARRLSRRGRDRRPGSRRCRTAG